MELTTRTEPWTAAVAWARPWQRPAAARRRPAPVTTLAWTGLAAADVAPDPDFLPAPERPDEQAWRRALAELAAARANRHATPDGEDDWPAAMAGHAVHLALRRVRLVAGQLDLMIGPFAGEQAGR